MTVVGPSKIVYAEEQSNALLRAKNIKMIRSSNLRRSPDYNSPVIIVPRLLNVYDLEQTGKADVYKYKPLDMMTKACKLSSRKKSLLFL